MCVMTVLKARSTTSINLPLSSRRSLIPVRLRPILKAVAAKEEECRNGGSREGLPNM
jgi:hypothetical protein